MVSFLTIGKHFGSISREIPSSQETGSTFAGISHPPAGVSWQIQGSLPPLEEDILVLTAVLAIKLIPARRRFYLPSVMGHLWIIIVAENQWENLWRPEKREGGQHASMTCKVSATAKQSAAYINLQWVAR
jgi:hypothetical protein